ncbi:MAG: hypothetical protein AB1806_00400 [Acidobacteriota bacterium]
MADDEPMLDKSALAAVQAALRGRQDEETERLFLEHFQVQVSSFETATAEVYDRWRTFESTFARDQDSATVVGALFTVVARMLLSMRFLILEHITMAGGAQRQALEALASAFLFAKYDWPYRQRAWLGRFPVHRSIDLLVKRSEELGLNREALEVATQAKRFYNKMSHPTIIAMGDLIGRGTHHLGPIFDPKKLPFYEKEIASRIGFAGILTNAIDGVASHMREWPDFRDRPGAT